MSPPQDLTKLPFDEGSGAPTGTGVNEIRIRGRYYDVSQFKKYHPGGSIISYYLGQDATEAFNAFHSRSTKVQKYLATVPSRPVEGNNNASGGFPAKNASKIDSYQETDPLVADFEKLRQDLYREGFFEPSLWHVAYRILEIVVMHAVGLQLLWNGWLATAIFILGLAQGRCGFLSHECGHYSLTGNMWVDRHIQMMAYSLGIGLSASYWRNQHNKHHAMPQKMKHDIDLQTLPLIAFNAEIAKNGNANWLRWQAFTFTPIITLLVGVTWQFYFQPRYALRARRMLELLYCFLRCLFIFGFVLRHYTAWQQLAIWLALSWVTTAYVFTNFALSHTHTPVVKETEQLDWVRFAACHTVDVEQALWCDWWMGYLNCQIEHHLFPAMPQFRTPMIVPRVRSLLQKHGIPHQVLSYWEAVKVTFSNLHSVGNSQVLKSQKMN